MNQIVVGLVKRAVGLRGELEIEVRSDDPTRFQIGRELFVDGRKLTIEASRTTGEKTFVRFQGVKDRNDADRLKRSELFVDESDLRQLDSFEFWDHDLEGCTVEVAGGEVVGTVESVNHMPGNDLLELSDGRLIPLVRQIVVEVDIAAKRIVIDPPEGLLG